MQICLDNQTKNTYFFRQLCLFKYGLKNVKCMEGLVAQRIKSVLESKQISISAFSNLHPFQFLSYKTIIILYKHSYRIKLLLYYIKILIV